MKKFFFSILAVAALAACTKSEVAYEASEEIMFAPTAKNITKGAIGTIDNVGVYPTDQRLGVYANYGDIDPNKAVTDDNVSSFGTAFLSDAEFSYKTVGSISAWGGGYSWPANGSLIFAGYSMPKTGNVGSSREYDFNDDELTIVGYTQSTNTAETFDLGWFGRTASSFNYRNQEDAVDVTLSHALAWIEIKVKGEGTTIGTNPWVIKSMTMNNVYNKGDVVCKVEDSTPVAKWTNLSNTTDDKGNKENTITIYTDADQTLFTSDDLTLSGTAEVCETNTAGTVVIPQTPTAYTPDNDSDTEVATLTVKYTYKSPAGVEMPEQTTTVPLVVTDGWKSGYKYTYTLTFRASEILISPEYDKWTEGTSQTVVVE